MYVYSYIHVIYGYAQSDSGMRLQGSKLANHSGSFQALPFSICFKEKMTDPKYQGCPIRAPFKRALGCSVYSSLKRASLKNGCQLLGGSWDLATTYDWAYTLTQSGLAYTRPVREIASRVVSPGRSGY